MPKTARQQGSLEFWPKLVEPYEPKAGTPAQGLLVNILTAEFDMSDLLQLIKQHDAIVDDLEVVQGRVTIATLTSRMGNGVVQDHFLVKRKADDGR